MQKNKLEVIRDWSYFISIVHIMQFIDFANFYKRFIRNFFKIAVFLIEMLKNNSNFFKKNRKRKKVSFSNDDEAFLFRTTKQAFEVLKQAFIIAFVLRHFDSIKKSKIKIDVFDKIVKVILSQQNENDH